MQTLIKTDNLPYTFHLSFNDHAKIFPKEQPTTINIVFPKRTQTAEVPEYIAEYLIENKIAEDYDPRYYKKTPLEMIEAIENDTRIIGIKRFKKLQKLTQDLGIWKYGMKKAKMIKLIKEYEATHGKNTN